MGQEFSFRSNPACLGLGLGDVDFYVDDIIYKGFSEESKFLPERITTSTDNISELITYLKMVLR